jgi:putative nucleotidyltransferase with HDIG domain
MHQILIVRDRRTRPEELARRLGELFEIDFQQLEAVFDLIPKRHTLIDVDLNNEPQLLPLKEWLTRKPENAKVIFVTEKASWLQEARAHALGATDALQSIFSAACSGAPVDTTAVRTASDAIVNQLEEQGLSAWIETVRMHHSQTYQHCLLVTGVAGAFAQHIGASRKDRQRLSFAGMLHDIGKARIPLAILEKPGRLDESEMAVMRKHPEYGLDALSRTPALPAEMLDMVVHHHEFLDGSGYPHGLQGSEISDLVRMMTISDVFGALIERRSYKPPLSGEAAYQILLDMGPKLDKDLVRAFKFAAASTFANQ